MSSGGCSDAAEEGPSQFNGRDVRNFLETLSRDIVECASTDWGRHRSPMFRQLTNTNETLSLGFTSRQDYILVYQSMRNIAAVLFMFGLDHHRAFSHQRRHCFLSEFMEKSFESVTSAVESAAADQVGVPRSRVTFCYLPNNQVW
jgi:hypothetical protein